MKRVLEFAVLSLIAPLSLPAQTTFGAITGLAVDATGAAVAGVAITATHTATGAESHATSNNLGVYTLPQLREGVYTIEATAPGFKKFVGQQVSIASREVRRVDIRLEVGDVATSIEVTAGVALIETETARVGDVKTGPTLNQMPLTTRDLRRFLSLSPNVGGGRNTDQFRFAGSFQPQNDMTVDGVTTNNGYTATPIGPMMTYIESFQEVRIDMANNTAEFGAMGQVSIVTKSGSNQLRGSLFDYYSTPAFYARNPFALERSGGIEHRPGFSIGGPILIPKLFNGRNRTFFFTSMETSRGSTVNQVANSTVGALPWRSGNFRNLAIRDPQGGAPFPGNQIPASRLNPTALKIQERFYPAPNYGDPNEFQNLNYRTTFQYPYQPETLWTTRLDHRFSEKSFVFARGSYSRATFDRYDSSLPGVGRRWNRRDVRGLNVSYTQFARANLLNEFRYGLTFNNNGRNGPLMGLEVARYLGLEGLADGLPDINGVLNVTWSNIGITGLTQTQYRKPGFQNFVQQFQDHVNWYAGKHSVKAGFVLTRVRFDDGQASTNLFGAVNFSNRYTGQPYADFLLGLPTSSSRGFPFFTQKRIRWAYDLFVTDDYKIAPHLTLNLGLRYELHPHFNELNGRQSIFDPASGQIGVGDGGLKFVSPLMPLDYVNVVEARTLGYPGGTLIRTDRNNIAPRIGVAWRPLGNNTVFRAGFGVYYDMSQSNRVSLGTPFEVSEPAYNNPAGAPVVVLPRIMPVGYAGRPTTAGLPNGVNPDLRIPYTLQYNVTMEHQRWDTGFRVSWIGTGGRQAEYGRDINSPVADGRLFVDKPRLFPRYPGINYFDNGAGHQFHSLTTEVERSMKHGLQWQFNWAWSRDIGDVDNAGSPEYAFDRMRERGVNTDIPTHRVTGNLIYELPFGKGKPLFGGARGAWDRIAGGWQISAIYQHVGGQFLTPQWTGPDPTGTRFTQNRTPANTTIRPDHLRNGNLPSNQRSLTRWFDAGAFASPQPGAFGNMARGVIIGPAADVFHAGVYKVIGISERVRFRWEMVASNAINHPNWGNPATNITQPQQVGTITGTGGPAAGSWDDLGNMRTMRMGLRLEW